MTTPSFSNLTWNSLAENGSSWTIVDPTTRWGTNASDWSPWPQKPFASQPSVFLDLSKDANAWTVPADTQDKPFTSPGKFLNVGQTPEAWNQSSAQSASVEDAKNSEPDSPSKKKNSEIEEELTHQSLYKTELCRSWKETGACRYGNKCQFAHGKNEVRPIIRHPKYKTEVCRTFQTTGYCPYETRCRFIHVAESDSDSDTQLAAPESPPEAPVVEDDKKKKKSRLKIFQLLTEKKDSKKKK